MLGPLRSTLRAIFGRTRWERDLDDELRSHLEHRAADLIRAGHSPRDAERQARLELGSARLTAKSAAALTACSGWMYSVKTCAMPFARYAARPASPR